MHFTKSTAIAVVAGLTFASAGPLLNSRQNGVTCQTSNASPSTSDVTLVINELKGKGGDDCSNTNGEASDCTTLVTQKGGAIGICGETNTGITCSEVADYANQVQQTCLSNGKVGGTFTINAGSRVIVFAS
ncbi:hypothetical protein F4782DRAFT_538309 [Xylaria castorea]|nr:hypothetical protein F4782DRAFT_538309 [Xylaria castorea]